MSRLATTKADGPVLAEAAASTTVTHSRDGISYKIDVTPQNGGFVAAWTCDRCAASGYITPEYGDAPEAVLSAKAHLFSEHHVRVHSN